MKKEYIYIEETDSTNRFLHDYQSAGEEMTIVYTDFQTAGRGQGTNHWESERGKNITFSILTHPREVLITKQFILSMAGGLAIKEVLDTYTEGITVKWPNDIYWHDKKISGTLIETSVSGKCINNCIFGVGININQRQFLSDAPNPVSLYQILGRETDRMEVLEKIVDRFDEELSLLQEGGSEAVRQRYLQALYRREGFHEYIDKDGLFKARLQTVEDDGHLVLEREDGRLSTYAFKEVQFKVKSEE